MDPIMSVINAYNDLLSATPESDRESKKSQLDAYGFDALQEAGDDISKAQVALESILGALTSDMGT